jgi:hypothetical protein
MVSLCVSPESEVSPLPQSSVQIDMADGLDSGRWFRFWRAFWQSLRTWAC